MVDVDDLATFLGFAGTPADPEALQRCLDAANGIITPHIVADLAALTPPQVQTLDLAILTVAADLWRRKDAPGGVYGFSDTADYPATLPRDPLTSVWAWLCGAALVNPAVVA